MRRAETLQGHGIKGRVRPQRIEKVEMTSISPQMIKNVGSLSCIWTLY